MKALTLIRHTSLLLLTLLASGAVSTLPAQAKAGSAVPARPQGPCDIYAAAGDPCVAAHSTTRALYAAYNGPLYQVLRQSDGKSLDIGVVQPSGSPMPDPGGYANAAAQDAFCAGTYCWIAVIYDQSPKHNDLTQAPRGGFSGPAMGGLNNLPLADMAPITIMGHKAYGVFIEPGMGLRHNDAHGTAVDDQAEGQYWVINGLHYNTGCCFDYGNAETDSRDDGNGTMETTYYGNSATWYHGPPPGPWVMTDQENNLVGCSNPDGSKFCPTIPTITWRFVTAMAKGEPHHWTSMGGDAQHGALAVMFNGPRINSTYDPMRKQGAILLGNGGDNSNSSQGTFYEGAMTAANTFPSDATDQQVQANVVAAGYSEAALTLTPSPAGAAVANAMPTGIQTFSPGGSQNATVTFTNRTGAPAAAVELSLATPGSGWTTVLVDGAHQAVAKFAEVAAGESVHATFKVTSGAKALNGDLVAHASWKGAGSAAGAKRAETTAVEKVRNASPVRINEFRVGTGSPANPTNTFIELYNAGSREVDLSNWALMEHPALQATFSAVRIPPGTKLAAGGFYLLGLANSGLAVPARAGGKDLYVRNTAGISAGDTVTIDTGANAETRKVASVGKAATNPTTLWQPLPDGQIVTIPAGATNVPVTSAEGFVVGEKIALGYGAIHPAVSRTSEQYEVATVTAVGKPGTQAYLAADAPAGTTNLKTTSVANISAGDKIRLDIDSVGHGIETVTVTSVGTQAKRTGLVANASAGATNIKVRAVTDFAPGEKVTIGTARLQTVTISAVGTAGRTGTGIDFTPALTEEHIGGEEVVNPGTGLELAAPLRFNHAANMPFSNRGTGVSFTPATVFPHSSDEPVQALGTGITLDSPLTKNHAIDAAVRDAAVTTAGYQGASGNPAPNQWFGGPALSPIGGVMVLRDAEGVVADSLNYGLLVEPWAAKGYQAQSGLGRNGCRVNAPGIAAGGAGVSAGRIHDGEDTDSNCADFSTEPGTVLTAATAAGDTHLKVGNMAGFAAGQTITIDTGASMESAVVETVGTPGPNGTGVVLTTGLKQAHAMSAPVAGRAATPGAPNHYDPRP